MAMPKFNITAYNNLTNERIHLFTWSRSSAAQGIDRAKSEAANFGFDKYLTDYKAEPIETADIHERTPMTAKQFLKWRIAQNWSQVEAAERLGCARNTVSAYEDGRSKVPHYIELACNALARSKA